MEDPLGSVRRRRSDRRRIWRQLRSSNAPKGVVDQKRMMETLLAKGIDGIAMSPVDAENQTPFLNEVSESTILITNDSDAPQSRDWSL